MAIECDIFEAEASARAVIQAHKVHAAAGAIADDVPHCEILEMWQGALACPLRTGVAVAHVDSDREGTDVAHHHVLV